MNITLGVLRLLFICVFLWDSDDSWALYLTKKPEYLFFHIKESFLSRFLRRWGRGLRADWNWSASIEQGLSLYKSLWGMCWIFKNVLKCFAEE